MNKRYRTIVDMERTSLIFRVPPGQVFLGEIVNIELENGEKRLGRPEAGRLEVRG